jgi:hypothetical protein
MPNTVDLTVRRIVFTRVAVDAGPLWLQYMIGFGTLGAAIFAGVAAFVARRSTRAAEQLIKLESGRDERAAEDALWHQARRISVDVMSKAVTLANARRAYDIGLVVRNASVDPVFKCRLKIIAGDALWGPQLVGTLAPGDRIIVMARLVTDANDTNTNGFVRFMDANSRAWVAEARGPLVSDQQSANAWVADAQLFAQRTLTPEERGSVYGGTHELLPDFDAWRTEMQGGPPWVPEP